MPAEPSCFASSVVTPLGYKAGGRSYATYIFVQDFPISLWLKRKRDREIDLEKNRRELLSVQGVVPPSLLFDGGVGLVRIGGHARAPAKSCESGVYDSGGVSYLSCA
jgi:hypothetical protein